MKKGKKYQWENTTVGTCYYPEHWDKSLWGSDLERMKKAGISVIRIAEFAWNKVEPKEGEIAYDFFDEFLDLCLKKDMKVIFGTPTATPPAWLTEKYPEVLNCRKDGVPYRHGSRRHYNYNSPVYQKLSANIVRIIAEHYGGHPAVIGWQIDNELNCEVNEFYSEADTEAFRSFLQGKYKTLEALNEAWGTAFWNQDYTDWQQVRVPGPLPSNGYNPHMHLDYFRFVSESAIRFCKMQADILRKYSREETFITTNGLFGNLDNHRMVRECLDTYTYDCYPNFAFEVEGAPVDVTQLNDRRWTRKLHETRSICPHFGIMEQQSGANGWTTRMEAPAPRPGQLTLWAMQSVANGADFISFFRWRTCTIGTEIYWHGILDYDSRDNRKLAEVTDFAAKMRAIDPVCGADYKAAFAVLKDYDNEWDAQVDKWHERVAWYSEEEIFAASELGHTPYDYVYLQQQTELSDLTPYPVIFYPHPVIMTKERADLLKQYVEQGGTLVIGCRSGYKDERGHCVMIPQPGLLAPLTGTDIRDFTFADTTESEYKAVWDEERIDVPIFHDILTPLPGTKTLAVYDCGYYKGQAALTDHSYGKGRVFHLGSAFSREMVQRILKETGVWKPFEQWIEAPETIELSMRQKGEEKFLFVLNFQSSEATVTLKESMKLMYTGELCQGEFRLPPYGTAVFGK